MNKIIMVTGGAGFIGSNFIKFMLNKYQDYKIINFDKLTYAGNLRNLSSAENNPNYYFVKGDIASEKDVKSIFEEFSPDYVVNFAAETHVDRSIMDSTAFIMTNVVGTQLLLDSARTNQIKKFVHISTDEVYGSLGQEGTFNENSPIKPNSPYSASKASSDLLVRAAWKTYGLNVNITRCSNNYGPLQFPEKLIPLMINNANNNKELPVYGNGTNVRDWIHVEDHCSAIDLVLHEGVPGSVYNIGADNEWKNIEIVKTILRHMNKPESLIRFVTDRPGHDLRYAIDSSKIQKDLGWKPQIEFSDGLKSTIDWYLSHSEWIEEIVKGDYVNYYKQMYEER
ncbi:MAG: dTDP-glucose 4,6-dehydratase [Candidatus Cloacimonetes bacterium]|nr:dTDP-glucose 4,6-dehydratase [Candidatus Cloacimonadota bacterium]